MATPIAKRGRWKSWPAEPPARLRAVRRAHRRLAFDVLEDRSTPAMFAFGSEFQVNTTAAAAQYTHAESDAAVAMRDDGKFVVVWTSTQDGTPDVFFQRYAADGTKLGGETKAHVASSGSEELGSVAWLGDGSRFVVTWTQVDGFLSGAPVYRVFDENGTAVTGNLLANTNIFGDQTNTAVASNPTNGDFVIAWQSNGQDGDGWGIYGQRFNCDGARQGGEFRINVSNGGDQTLPSVAMNSSGQFYVAWTSDTAAGTKGVYVRKFAADGTALTGEVQANASIDGNQQASRIAANDDGFVVVWQSDQGGNYGPVPLAQNDIFGQRFDSNADYVGGEFLINQTTAKDQIAPHVSMAADGDFLVAWQQTTSSGANAEIVVRKFRSDGTGDAEAIANANTGHDQVGIGVTMDDRGRAVLAWSRPGDQTDVVARLAVYERRILVTPLTGTTTEAGGTATFSVALNAPPASNVSVMFTSSDTSEGTVTPSLLFTPTNWSTPQVVTVTGVNDPTDDGDVAYSVSLSMTTGDVNWAGIAVPQLDLVNLDDDTASIIVTPLDPFTSEGGGAGSFTVKLGSRPSASVSIPVASSNTAEGTVAVTTLTFTTSNWNTAQTVTVTGVNDGVVDHDKQYYVRLSAASSTDSLYRNMDADDVRLVNTTLPQGTNDAYATTEGQSLVVGPGGASGDGLVGWYRMNEGTGDRALDSSGLGHHAQLGGSNVSDVSDPTWATSGDGSRALAFDGVDDSVQTPVDLKTADSFTLSVWFKTDTTIGQHHLLWQGVGTENGWGDPGLANAQVAEMNLTVGRYNQDNRITFFLGYDVNHPESLDITSLSTFTDTTNWHHAVVVVSGLNSGAATASLFVDGRLEGTDTGTETDRSQWDAPMRIGRPGASTRYFKGLLDEVRAYNRALATDEIAELRQEGVLKNDRGSGTLTATLVDQPLHGTATLNPNGTFTYTPTAGYVGPDRFTYRVNDGTSTSALTTANLVVAPATNAAIAPTDAGPVSSAAGTQETRGEVRGSTRAVTHAADGSYVVVWSAQGTDGSGWGVYGQRFDAMGNPLGAAFQVNQALASDQSFAAVAMNTLGEFVVTWTSAGQDGSGNGVYARRYDAAGAARGGEFLVNQTTAGDQDSSVVAIGGDGRFVIVWEGVGAGGVDGIHARWFDGAGAALTDETVVEAISTTSGQGEPSVTMRADGRTIVMWDNSGGVWVRIYDANGNAITGEINVDPNSEAGQADVRIADDGSFVVVWRVYYDSRDVFVRRFAADGTPLNSATLVNETTVGLQTNPSLAMDGAGNFLVTWEGEGPGDADGIFGRLYDATGAPRGGEFLVTSTTDGNQSMASATMIDADNYVVVWTDSALGVLVLQTGTANVAPVAANDDYAVDQGTSLAVPAPGVLSNDSDLNHDTLVAQLVTNVAHGTLTLNPNGGFTYTPNAGFSGSDSFTYRVFDGQVASAVATVNLVVNPVNHAPTVTAPNSVRADASGAVAFAGPTLISVGDPDGGSVEVDLHATGGALTLITTTGLTFSIGTGAASPDLRFVGTLSAVNAALASLRYQAAPSATAPFSLDVSVSDAPTAGAAALTASASVAIEVFGLVVSPALGTLTTAEAGGSQTTATFTVALRSAPPSNVVVTLVNSDPSEGTLSTTSLTFTSANWYMPQTVTVTRVDDAIDDGDVAYQISLSATHPASATLTATATVSVTNLDNDTAGIVVAQSGSSTTEAGGTATFTVRLASQPTANVEVPILSSNTAEGTVSTNKLTFTTSTWNVAQTVTVTGANDDIDDGDVGYAIRTQPAISSDANYSGRDAVDVPLVNVDNDTAGYVVTTLSGPTSETGTTATFTVRLTSAPTANVIVSVASSNVGEATVSTTALTFNASNWNVAQTVTVTGVNDDVVDGTKSYTILLGQPTGSSDTTYAALDPADVGGTNLDDDTAGYLITPLSGATSESGTTATFTVRLTSAPTANVNVSVASSNVGEATVSTTALTFNASNWNVAQTVTVTGVNDDIADGTKSYTILLGRPAASGDATYAALDPADVGGTNLDDDVAGYLITPLSGPTSETGTTATFSVRLTSAPTANVVVSVASSNVGEATVSTTGLTFNASNWNVAQTVTVTGVNDDVADGTKSYTILLGRPTGSGDATYAALDPADVSGANLDDDVAGYVITPISGPTAETGTTATFTVRLTSRPTANVVISVASSNVSEGTVSTSALTFTPTNWATAQTVTVTGVDDMAADGPQAYQIVLGAPTASSDAVYATLDPSDVAVTNSDNDVPAILVTATLASTTEAGGTATISVRLATQPLGTVTIGALSSDASEGAVLSGPLTFDASNWNVAQTVTVRGVDDFLDDGDVNYAVALSVTLATDSAYAGMAIPSVNLANVDDDTAGIIVSAPSGSTTEAGGTATFTVTLAAQPTGPIRLTLSVPNSNEASLGATSLLFDASNWNAPKTVLVIGENDSFDDGNVPFSVTVSVATAADPAFVALPPASVTLTNVDNDTAGLVVSPVSGPTSENGAPATFAVSLAAAPSGTVVVNLTSNNVSEGSPSLPSLTFNSTNWNVAQTVTINGVDDAFDDGDVAYAVRVAIDPASDSAFATVAPVDVALVNVDDDQIGVIASPMSGPTTEAGGQATFSLRLASRPTGSLRIVISTSDASEAIARTTQVLFDGSNWDQPQIVTIEGVDDLAVDGDVGYAVHMQIADSADLAYAALAIADVAGTTRDNDLPGFVVTQLGSTTTEAGGTASFRVVLSSQPLTNVTLDVVSLNTAEGLPQTTSVTFTSANWNVAQTITIRGVQDMIDDGDQPFTVRISVNAASDTAFRSLAPQDVAFVNSDDDTASLTIDPVVGVASESGATAAYTVRLGSMPTATVRLVASVTGGDGRVTVVGGPVFVSSTQFYLPQTFVVSIADDLIDGPDVPYTLTVTAESTDPLYSNRTATANGTALDNDVAGFVVSQSAIVVGENGPSASFTVQLTSQPIAPVRVDLAPSVAGRVTLSATSLTFDATNWSHPQTVVVTGVDDFVAAPDLNLTLALTVVSSDATYASLTPPDVAVTVVNDDVPGVLVSPTAFDVVEGGAGSFGVRLASKPTAPVTVTFATVGDVTLDVASLTFNAANWNVVQTVTVHGVDDPDINGDRPFTVRLLPTTSADPNYLGVDPTDVTGLVHDNDVAQIVTTPLVGQVSEAGATATFTVRLTARPKAEVRIALATNAPTQATTDVPELVFDASNWNVAQTVVVRGTDDFVDDGDLPFDVLIGPATSTDRDFANLSGPTLASVVLDDDTAGVQIRLVSGQPSENGGQAIYAVRLASQPIGDVGLVASSSDTNEGSLYRTNFTFDGSNWDQEQTFVVQGVDDVFVDGDVGFALAFDAGGSADATYAGLTPTTTAIANADDDVADLVVTIDQAASTEGGETAQVRVRLASQPTSDVVVRIASSDPSEGTLQKSVLVFTAANWNQTQSVVVRGVDDAMNDGDQTYALAFVVQSADANYQGLARSTSLVNRDNDAIPNVFSVASTSTGGTGSTTATTTAGSGGGTTLGSGSTTSASGGSATSVSGGTGGPAGDASEPTARVANDPKEPASTESANVSANPLPPPAIQTLAAPLQGTPNLATPAQTPGQPASGQPATPTPTSPRPTPSVSPGATYVSGIPGVLAQLTPAQEQARDADLASRSAVQRQLLGEFLDPVATENRTNRVVTATVATTVVATAGYALLATRLASWVFTLATAQPVWLRFDPMHILSAWEKDRKRKRDDDESLQTMVNRHRKTAPVL